MSPDENRQIIIDYWFEKSRESLQAAKRDLEANSPGFAMNRIYYSAFYAVSAVLMTKGLSFKKHSGVRSTFHLSIVKEGLIDPEWGKFYDRLFEDRQESDYVALVTFDSDYVQQQYERCEILPSLLMNL